MRNSKNFIHNLVKSFTVGSLKESEREEDLEKVAAQEQKQFRFDTLVAATGNFHPSHKLGEGGFGPVFKGKLDDGREIAVKRLSRCSKQGMKEFKNEAKLLARVQHRNIVELLGYCVHREDKLLVYEYVSNESLDKLLFKSNQREVLNWKRRYEIINGIARGLLYLHEDSHKVIIHRDIKASNILLDDRWVPKIADFGLARLFPEDETHVNTHVAGTNGYMAPEYVIYGHLSTSADVFSFGVLALELISGKRNSSFDSFAHADNLLEWAYKLHKRGRSKEIVDPALAESTMPEEQVAMCIQIGLLCVQGNPALRPTMRRVVVMLSRKLGNLDKPTRPGLSGLRYNSTRRHGGQSETLSESHSSSTNKSSTFTASGSRPARASTSASTSASTYASTSASTSKRAYVSALRSISSDSGIDSRGKQPARS